MHKIKDYNTMVKYTFKLKCAIILAILVISCCQSKAQDVSGFWIAMPDGLIPYLNKEIRTELIDNKKKGLNQASLNLFQDTVRIITLTDSYLKVDLSRSSEIEIKRFTSNKGQTLFAMVRTYKAPSAESSLAIYTDDWQKVKGKTIDASLLIKPEAMSQETFSHLLSLSDPQMIEMHLSPTTETVSLSISYPFLSQEERTETKNESLQTIVNLNSMAEN